MLGRVVFLLLVVIVVCVIVLVCVVVGSVAFLFSFLLAVNVGIFLLVQSQRKGG